MRRHAIYVLTLTVLATGQSAIAFPSGPCVEGTQCATDCTNNPGSLTQRCDLWECSKEERDRDGNSKFFWQQNGQCNKSIDPNNGWNHCPRDC
jgi:hypothetical protein